MPTYREMDTVVYKECLAHCITLRSGRLFNLRSPELNDEILIEDIAHGLSHVCRYAGQCFRFYSVAEHSVLVSQSVPPAMALTALLHDASEAFIGDITRPLKRLLPDYQVIEDRVETFLAKQFGITYPYPQEIKQADDSIALAEVQCLMPERNGEWLVNCTAKAANVNILCLDPVQAKDAFLGRYERLVRGL